MARDVLMTLPSDNPNREAPRVENPDQPIAAEETMATLLCRGDHERKIEVVQYRHVKSEVTAREERRRLGAIDWRTADGRPVRQIDADLYEIQSSGELLKRVS